MEDLASIFRSLMMPQTDLSALPPARVSPGEAARLPGARAALHAQRNPATALEGELGVFHNPGGGHSTELSQTVVDPRLNAGAPTNIPMLVQGQDEGAIGRILAGRDTGADLETAIARAAQRATGGQPLPAYLSMGQAISEAGRRSQTKQGPWR